ncbi:unnamed protein product [marine sediment metagenome]|uniref:Uncharacterized protein n=1 Tax=marine sediment metagenome TaxID=412755 RepID=X1HAB2_9ZZZZ
MIVEAIIEIDEKKKRIIKIHSSREMGYAEFKTWQIVQELLSELKKIYNKRGVR